jgi:hypothetical protein
MKGGVLRRDTEQQQKKSVDQPHHAQGIPIFTLHGSNREGEGREEKRERGEGRRGRGEREE